MKTLLNCCNIIKIQSFYEKLLFFVYSKLVNIRSRKLFLYVIGSIAKNEVSCLELENNNVRKLVISDLDLIVLTDLISFIKCMLFNCTKIADVITNTLRRKGIETHISITLIWPTLYKLLRFFKFNTINFYEMKMVKCLNVSRRCLVIDKVRRPAINPEDVMNLVISSLADYLLVAVNDTYVDEAVYIIAKRVLSLLYALELSLGLMPKGFTEVPIVAEENFERVSNVIGRNELKLLRIIADFKRNCDLDHLRQSIRDSGYEIASDNDLLEFLLGLFERYAKKIFSYLGHSIDGSNILKFIRETEQSRRKRRLMLLLINLITLLPSSLLLQTNKGKNVLELISMFRHRLSLGDFLRLLILKFSAILLYRGRCKALLSPKLKDLGRNIAYLWREYMI